MAYTDKGTTPNIKKGRYLWHILTVQTRQREAPRQTKSALAAADAALKAQTPAKVADAPLKTVAPAPPIADAQAALRKTNPQDIPARPIKALAPAAPRPATPRNAKARRF